MPSAQPYHPVADEEHPVTSPIREENETTVLFERPSMDEPIPYEEAVAQPPAPSTLAPPASQPGSSQGRPPRSNDGVFANILAAKSEPGQQRVKEFTEIEPPSYAEATLEPTPQFFEPAIVTSIAEDGEVLVDGLPVGGFFPFIVNMIVSMSFDFIGFLLTTLMATTLAAKLGSRAGLGMTLIRYGFLVRNPPGPGSMDDVYGPYDGPEGGPMDRHRPPQFQVDFVSYILIAVGFFILLRANAEFIRARRLRAMVQTAPSVVTVV